jgi:hypothetical protein
MKSVSHTNPGSRHAVMDSLYRRHTFIIDSSPFSVTHDKAFYNGHFYSPKPPLLSIIGAGFYGIYAKTTGNTFRSNFKSSVRFTSFIIGLVPHVLLLIYFYACLNLMVNNPAVKIAGFSTIAVGYLGWSYATEVNNHSPTAAVFIMAFYFYLKIKDGSSSHWSWFGCGFLSGLIPTFDHPSLVLSLALFYCLIPLGRKKSFLLFFLGALIPILAHFGINYFSLGTFKPLQWIPNVFYYPNSYWSNPQGIDTAKEPKHIYAFHMLFGHHGFFSMSPLLFIGFISMLKSIFNRDSLKRESISFLFAFLALVLFYIKYTQSYGGFCIGYRWLIPIMPLMFLYSARWLDLKNTLGRQFVFGIFLAIGVFNACDGLENPFIEESKWHRFLIKTNLSPCYSGHSKH